MAGVLDAILAKHPGIVSQTRNKEAWARQIGTLGGGNHFIEVCLDQANRVWVMLHSGSRGIGNLIGRYFIEQAKEQIAKLDVQLPDRDLAYQSAGTGLFADYWEALTWAQDYAARNRQEMLDIVLAALGETLPPFTLDDAVVNCHHNYTQLEAHDGEEVYVTRKGAIRAGKGELGIIPGSMGAKSYIVRGKGNAASFCSCSHGAGRRMSRSAAKRRFSREDLVTQTAGVECRKEHHEPVEQRSIEIKAENPPSHQRQEGDSHQQVHQRRRPDESGSRPNRRQDPFIAGFAKIKGHGAAAGKDV